MIPALRITVRSHPPPSSLFSSPLQSSRRTTSLRFSQATADSKNMDKDQMQAKKTDEDVMQDSFGEGYSTRSDEEGFGGTIGGNQSLPIHEHRDVAKQNKPGEYDKSQGSEVKEKEKGRHQSDA